MTKRLPAIFATALLWVALGAFAAPAGIDRKLEGGSPSVDELVARFLDALGKNDAATLRRLRVTREEYLGIILPGTVPVGAERRHWRDDVNEYAWSVLHTKSVYSEANILAGYGGRTYRAKHIDYRKGTQRYAAYTAFKQLEIVMEDEAGTEHAISTGSVAEVDGQYKFISFIRD